MKRFKNILYVIDAGEACKPTLERAAVLAENNQASLTVVGFIESVAAPGLENLIHPYRKRIEVQTKTLKGTPFLEIIREVLRNGHDLVIKNSETQDWLNRFFGSADMHLLRKCPCPVWLINPDSPKAFRRILAAVDVGQAYPPEEQKSQHELSVQILEMASSLAVCEFAELHIVHTWELSGESVMRGPLINMPEEKILAEVEQVRREHTAWFNELLREVSRKLDQERVDYPEPRTHLVKGGARKEISVLAKRIEADLVVMGTVARIGVPGFFMGNTAETVLNQIECSVLAIKPTGFVTPVTLVG